MQTLLVYPEFARGALDVLGRWQAKERDDYRDAEPGKILHELRYGELAHFKLIPHTPYYGTADATPLYLVVLHAAWRATGDRALLERFLPNAEAALDWIDNWGDRDGDGFQEYQTRSPVGYENMSWKDSGDSMRMPDGTPGEGTEGGVRAARLCLRRLAAHGGGLRRARIAPTAPPRCAPRPRRCSRNSTRPSGTRRRASTPTCWTARSARSGRVASNPGHLLLSGIVPEDRAARVVARLLAPDMDSGWGIRTLSAAHPAYNPYSYQNGSVWPHDNGIIALGFKRYGLRRRRRRRSRARSAARRAISCSTRCRNSMPGWRTGGRLPGAVSRRQRAAGLGGGLGLHAGAGDARASSRTRRAGRCMSIP